jgi:hypothetical protein
VNPQQHTRHIAIDDGGSFSMHDARHRSRRVPTDARQGGELGRALRNTAAEPHHALLGGLMQAPSATVVAKPLPLGEDLVFSGSRKRGHRWPARHEHLEALDHSTDLRLLQHALADEGAITAPLAPPRKVPRMLGEPWFDRSGEPLCRGRTSRRADLCATLALPTPGVVMAGAAAPLRGSPAD